MIPNSSVPSVVQLINKSAIPFYLTGSRYFGNALPTSDWDFFTDAPVNREFAQFLDQVGKIASITFLHRYSDSYADSQFIGVYHIVAKDCEVHIQIVKSASLKFDAQEHLKQHNRWHSIDKRTMPKLAIRSAWESAYTEVRTNAKTKEVIAKLMNPPEAKYGHTKIYLTKLIRDAFGCSLSDAKNFVDKWVK